MCAKVPLYAIQHSTGYREMTGQGRWLQRGQRECSPSKSDDKVSPL